MKMFEQTGSPYAPITWPEEFQYQSEKEYKEFWEKHDPRDVDE
jgi:sulfite oxidase